MNPWSERNSVFEGEKQTEAFKRENIEKYEEKKTVVVNIAETKK